MSQVVTGFKLILNDFSHVHVASVPMAVTSGIYWGYFQGSARQAGAKLERS